MKNPFNRKIKLESIEIDGEEYIKFDSNFEKFRYYQGNFLTMILIVVLVIMGLGLGYIIINYLSLLTTSPCDICKDLGYSCVPMISP